MLNGWDGVLWRKKKLTRTPTQRIVLSLKLQINTWMIQSRVGECIFLSLSCLASSDHSTCTGPSGVEGTCGHYMISVHYDVVLLMVILLVPADLRSSSSCHVVLGCSFSTWSKPDDEKSEILRGAPDRGRLIVNCWCFFHFLIIAPTDWQAARWEAAILESSRFQSCADIQGHLEQKYCLFTMSKAKELSESLKDSMNLLG